MSDKEETGREEGKQKVVRWYRERIGIEFIRKRKKGKKMVNNERNIATIGNHG